jgi:hypothetical protein
VPEISTTTRGETPWTSRSVAQECRRSWNRTSGKPARPKITLNERTAFRASSGVPIEVVNT